MRQGVMIASVNDRLSSCWKCNTDDNVTHISWRYIKTSQLGGSFIRPVNVILITSSISTHMSRTNAGNEIFLSFKHTLHLNLFLICPSIYSKSHFLLRQLRWRAFINTHTHIHSKREISRHKEWWWRVKLCMCTHACCLTSAYGLRARRQLGLAWITAPWLGHCSSDTPPLTCAKTHFLPFTGLSLTSSLLPISIPNVQALCICCAPSNF